MHCLFHTLHNYTNVFHALHATRPSPRYIWSPWKPCWDGIWEKLSLHHYWGVLKYSSLGCRGVHNFLMKYYMKSPPSLRLWDTLIITIVLAMIAVTVNQKPLKSCFWGNGCKRGGEQCPMTHLPLLLQSNPGANFFLSSQFSLFQFNWAELPSTHFSWAQLSWSSVKPTYTPICGKHSLTAEGRKDDSKFYVYEPFYFRLGKRYRYKALEGVTFPSACHVFLYPN